MKKTPIQELIEQLQNKYEQLQQSGDLVAAMYVQDAIELAHSMLEKEKERYKGGYIAGYLDNGYYEGAEEDAAKLWEKTYGFIYEETFNTKEK